ncbi:hypothetical protein [Methanolobus sp. WCC4]|uniref:hypothetical protein n=1 Tax=Methanolobus sp. WCC4 TaxID=3125784 RepID=UPI0030FC38CC
MKLKALRNNKNKYLGTFENAFRNPKNSIFLIIGIPFIFALVWVLLGKLSDSGILNLFTHFFNPYLILVILMGSFIPFVLYSYYTGNKASSAIMGLLLFPLMFFYVEIIGIMASFEFERLTIHFYWGHALNSFRGIWPLSIVHALIGFLVASRKQIYLVAAFSLFILQLAVLIMSID